MLGMCAWPECVCVLMVARRHNRSASDRDLVSVQAVLAIFQGQDLHVRDRARQLPTTAETSTQGRSSVLIAIAAEDVVATLDALHPAQRTASICSDQNTLKSGLHSSASSMSGFSLFRNGTDDLQSPLHSSILRNADVKEDDTSSIDISHLRDELDDLAGSPTTTNRGLFSAFTIDEHNQDVLLDVNEAEPGIASPLTEPASECWIELLKILRIQLSNIGTRMTDESPLQAQLPELLHDMAAEAEAHGDFVMAHRLLSILEKIAGTDLHSATSKSLTDIMKSTATTEQASISCDRALQHSQEILVRITKNLTKACSDLDILRDKMWYTSTIRMSAEYERLQSLTSALRAMSRKQSSVKTLRTSTRPAIPTLKSGAQILELVSASHEHGSLDKLNSEQSKSVKNWLAFHQIQNLCTTEERIHRLCMEVRKAVEMLVNPSEVENPMLWEDILYKGSKPAALQLQSRRRESSRPMTPAFFMPYGAIRTPQALSNTSSYEHMDARSPTLTSRSSNNFWSPAVTETRSQSSATSVGSGWQTDRRPLQSSQKLEKQLYHRVTGFILGECNLFRNGSETDEALWAGIGSELLIRSAQVPSASHSQFDFRRAFRTMFAKFSASPNPQAKLQLLGQIQQLLPAFMSTINKPRIMVDGFVEVLSDVSIRPKTLLRDLQYISSLVPQSVLDDASTDNAFWNAAIAASRLKENSIKIMVETADAIIAFHTSNRGSASLAQLQRDAATFASITHPPSVDIAAYSMSDAGTLLQIAAKDGNAAAQRELATLYLTHPDLLDRVIAPFAQPKEVFRDELENKWKTNDKSRCDPLTMCVAHHWMLLSSKGGDGLAKEYLKQREEMERLP